MMKMKYIKSINEQNANLAMYYFNPNDYGEQYMVLAKSGEEAFNSVIEHIKKEIEHDKTKPWAEAGIGNAFSGYYDKWLKATFDKLPSGYTIEVFNIGEVLATEIS